MEINPYSAELRYTADFLAFCAITNKPSSLRLETTSVEIAKCIARRLPSKGLSIFVNNKDIQISLQNELGINTHVSQLDQAPADIGLFPFSLDCKEKLRGEKIIIGSTYNAFSYKSLVYPVKVRTSLHHVFSLLKSKYYVLPVASLYSPNFIFYYMLAKSVERWNSSLYFQLESLAMARLIDFSWQWRLSYIVIFAGRTSS